MSHAPAGRFPFEKHEKLDDAERRERQPVAPVLEALDLAPDHVVLDLGAGTGYFAVPIALCLGQGRGLAAGRVIAADVEPRMLGRLALAAAAARADDRVERLVVDGSPSLPLLGSTVDRALVANLYHELPDRRCSLAQLHRVLRPGGKLLLVDWDPEGIATAGPPVPHRISAAQAEAELRAEGFRTVERLPLYRDHWALRAVK
jgi:SAM-dependent methyltransferase